MKCCLTIHQKDAVSARPLRNYHLVSMDSTFTKREIYGERVVKERATTITLDPRRIMGGLQVPYQGREDQVDSGTRVILEILVDTLREVTI